MKIHGSILLVLAMSSLILQGCGGGGTWFPNTKPPPRRQTRWDNEHRVSCVEETSHITDEDSGFRYDGHPYNRDLQSVNEDKR